MAVQGANTIAVLNALFKEVYSSKIADLVPEGIKLLKMIPFAKKEQALGGFYH